MPRTRARLAAKLRALASQENHDGEPWDTMIEAAAALEKDDRMDALEARLSEVTDRMDALEARLSEVTDRLGFLEHHCNIRHCNIRHCNIRHGSETKQG